MNKRTTLKCDSCGHTVEIFESEIELHRQCELCGGYMSELDAFVDRYQTNQMKDKLRLLGVERVWMLLEQEKRSDVRVRARKIFFLAGGIAPERNPIKERITSSDASGIGKEYYL